MASGQGRGAGSEQGASVDHEAMSSEQGASIIRETGASAQPDAYDPLIRRNKDRESVQLASSVPPVGVRGTAASSVRVYWCSA
jgi:hypothetical protein